MKIVKPNDDLTEIDPKSLKIFLAGGMKKPWRKELTDKLSELDIDFTIIDPSIDNWEKDIGEETIENEKYIEQTNWEHDGLDKADVQIFHFDDTSLSPITLFELGMFVGRDSIMYLEDNYEKKSYVEYIALRFNVPIVKTLNEVVSLISIRYHTR